MSLRKELTAIMLLLLYALRAAAYDFSATAPTGQTLYLSYCTGGVKVVYPGNTAVPAQGWNGYVRPTGALAIPGTVSHDGVSYTVVAVEHHAFYGCNGLTALTLGEGVAAVRANAFGLCTALNAITLPSTVDSLGSSAFYNCTSLQVVTVRRAAPPVTATTAFYDVPLSAVALVVPCGCVAAYTAASPWSSFATVDDAGCVVTVATGVNNLQRGSVSGGGDYADGAVALQESPAAFERWCDNRLIEAAKKKADFHKLFSNSRNLMPGCRFSLSTCIFTLKLIISVESPRSLVARWVANSDLLLISTTSPESRVFSSRPKSSTVWCK